jgi:hypothetical protein
MDAPSQPHPMDFMRKDRWSPAKRRRINPELFMYIITFIRLFKRYLICQEKQPRPLGLQQFRGQAGTGDTGHIPAGRALHAGQTNQHSISIILTNYFPSQLFSAPFKNHRAQADSEALLQVCLAYGLDFLSFVDRNSSAFPACFRKNVV